MLGNLSDKTGIGDYSYGTRNWNYTVSGVPQILRGGKFIAGFLSAGVTQAFAGAISGGVSLGGTVTAATVGGATSVLGGGKFGNGTATAAFSRLFNWEKNYWHLQIGQGNGSLSLPMLPREHQL